jgi:hypothetical protein
MKAIIMNVKVEIKFSSNPEKQNYDEMNNAAESITNNLDSIVIYQRKQPANTLVAEFTIQKKRQIDVVDKIGKIFSYNLEDYLDSFISFPKKISRKKIKSPTDKDGL